MFKNNLRIAFRHLMRHKLYSFLSIIGLSIGIAAGFLIFLYVHFELSYDTFNTKADRIYRLVSDVKTSSETLNTQFTSPPMGINIKTTFPEVEDYVRQNTASLMFSDSSLFKIFDFKLIEGDPNTALVTPFSIVLTESAAKKYFGNTNPIGKPILLTGGNFMSHVTGIMKDIPENSQIKADIIISWPTLKIFGDSTSDQNWTDIRATTYLLLKPGSNPKKLESQFPRSLKNWAEGQIDQNNMHFSLFLEPLLDVHLKSGRGGMDTGNISNVYIFTIIGIFVILIASINFVNLTTVRATDRAKEVGIRKVVGAERNGIARQFLSESILVAIIAFILSLLICALSLPWFNELAGKTISTSILGNPVYVGILFLMSAGIGLIAGLYSSYTTSSITCAVRTSGLKTARPS
jgi:putative ABC transport system permease protein